ncbi:MAG: PIN domain-containing protein [Cyanobacteria bacterium P01_F01_bin.143]
MKVVVDTSVWSLALRRRKNIHQNNQVILLQDLIRKGSVILLGVVRQEILSGIRHQNQYENLKQTLRTFPDLRLQIEDYELASEFYNTCRGHGIQGSSTDFLICAVAVGV